MKAKVAFTYGWNDHEIMQMSWKTFLEYWQAITPIEAQQALLGISIANYSKMKKEARQKLDAQLKRDAYSTIDKNDGRLANYSDIVAKFSRT